MPCTVVRRAAGPGRRDGRDHGTAARPGTGAGERRDPRPPPRGRRPTSTSNGGGTWLAMAPDSVTNIRYRAEIYHRPGTRLGGRPASGGAPAHPQWLG